MKKERPLKAVQPRSLTEKLHEEDRQSHRQEAQRRRTRQLVRAILRQGGGDEAA